MECGRLGRMPNTRSSVRRRRPLSSGSDSDDDDSNDSLGLGRPRAATARAGTRKKKTKKQKKAEAPVRHSFPDATLSVSIEKNLKAPQQVRASLLRGVCAGEISDDHPGGPIPEFDTLFSTLQGLARDKFDGEHDEDDGGVLFMWPPATMRTRGAAAQGLS